MMANLATDLIVVVICSTMLLHLTIAEPVEAVIATRIVIRIVTVVVAVEAVPAVPKMTQAVLADVKNAVIEVETLIVNALAEAMLAPVVLAARRRTETVNAMLIGETLALERRCAGGTDTVARTGLQKWVVLLPTAATPTRTTPAPVHRPQWAHHPLPRHPLHLPFRMMRTLVVGGKAATVPRTGTGTGSAVTAGASVMAITVRAVVAPRIASVAGPTTPRRIPGGKRTLGDEWAARTSASAVGNESTH
jgi:hypothetical protein